MRRRSPLLLVAVVLLFAAGIAAAAADKQTVCTITVNSDDEREAFRRNLPPDRFDFVELVERGRPDWLGAACRKGVRCDVLLISGHFDDGSEFYSDRVDSHDHLPVTELERAACTDGCSGLFSQLKEVYLFGCNTLNADAVRFASGEAVRSLVRAGHAPADADALARTLEARLGDSNRDRMRVVFKDTPVIYGFSSKAPLGARAGPLLERYFKTGGASDIGQGRSSAALLGLFAGASMKSAVGVTATDPQAGHRNDVCRFVDDAQPPAEQAHFLRAVMQRNMAEVALYLDRIDTLSVALSRAPAAEELRAALAALAHDADARRRYLDMARDADELATVSRMLAVAKRIGWVTDESMRAEFVAAIGRHASRGAMSAADVDTVCAANARHELDVAAGGLDVHPKYADSVANAAALACLGKTEQRNRALRGLTADDERDAQIAQVYVRRHPLQDADEFRRVVGAIAQMRSGPSQVRALDALAVMRVSDRDTLTTLAALYPRTRSLDVQRAIAGVLIRADTRGFADAEVVRALRRHRLLSPDGEDVIDVLIRRLQTSS